MSYRKSHIKNKIYKIRSKKPLLASPIFWLAFLFVVLAGGVAYLLFFYPGLQVKYVEVSGAQKTNPQEISELALSLSSKKFIFFINERQLAKNILQKMPQLSEAKVAKKLPQTLEISVLERQASAFFCQKEENGQNCFSVDNSGIIFEQDPLKTGPIIVPAEKQDLFLGKKAVDEQIVKAVAKIDEDLKNNFNISVSEALISSPLMLDIITSENWRLYLDFNSDIKTELLKLNALLNNEISEKARQDLQYIDLRFDKAYYK